jgi:hypothetical protein
VHNMTDEDIAERGNKWLAMTCLSQIRHPGHSGDLPLPRQGRHFAGAPG